MTAPDALLVVIDMQRVFQDPASPWATPDFDGLVRPIGSLASAFADRVIFTRFLLPEREGSWGPYFDTWSEVTKPERSAWLELAEPWASKDVHTLDVPGFSKWGPDLEALAGPARVLVLAGVATDCCVVATALAAVDAGMFVRVAADACRGADDAAHQRALRLMDGFAPQIEVTDVNEELRRRAGAGLPA